MVPAAPRGQGASCHCAHPEPYDASMIPDAPMTDDAAHWEAVYRAKAPVDVSWYQARPHMSLDLITEAGLGASSPIIDIGGGSSTLVDHLLDVGHEDLTVLDISPSALALAQRRLGTDRQRVKWVHADVRSHRFTERFALWHDRAAFHFFCDAADREAYAAKMRTAVEPGGSAIVATFALDGPERCSGLEVHRYGPESMAEAFAEGFEAARFIEETHITPSGGSQRFLYGRFVRT